MPTKRLVLEKLKHDDLIAAAMDRFELAWLECDQWVKLKSPCNPKEQLAL